MLLNYSQTPLIRLYFIILITIIISSVIPALSSALVSRCRRRVNCGEGQQQCTTHFIGIINVTGMTQRQYKVTPTSRQNEQEFRRFIHQFVFTYSTPPQSSSSSSDPLVLLNWSQSRILTHTRGCHEVPSTVKHTINFQDNFLRLRLLL